MKIYLVKQENTQLFKIGVTKKNILERIFELQTGNPNKIILVDEFETKWNFKLENYLHNYFKLKHVNGEWFELNKEDINNFISICNKGENMFNILKKSNNPFI